MLHKSPVGWTIRSRCAAGAVLAGGLLLAACAEPQLLRPAAPLQVDASAAEARQAGVQVTVKTDAWNATPGELASVLTPLYVEVKNTGPRDLPLRYQDFRLVTEDGRAFAALPPRQIRETVRRPVGAAYERYGDDPRPFAESRLWHHFATVPPTAEPLHQEGLVHERPRPRAPFSPFVEVALPTRDMIERALPQGALPPGAAATGFLYFQEIESAGPVTFEMDIPSPPGRRAGALQIRLVAG